VGVCLMADERESGFDIDLRIKERVSWAKIYRWLGYAWRVLIMLVLTVMGNKIVTLSEKNAIYEKGMEMIRHTVTTEAQNRMEADKRRDEELSICKQASQRFVKYLDNDAREARLQNDFRRMRKAQQEKAEIEKILNPSAGHMANPPLVKDN
jgi:hypothetical protein